MAYWMCTSCGHCVNDCRPPEACPHCGKTCSFGDVTCYRPECGGEQHTDPLLTVRSAGPKAVDRISSEAKRPSECAGPVAFNPYRNRGAEW